MQPSQGPAEKRKYTIRKVVIQDGDLYITEPEGHTDGFQKYFITCNDEFVKIGYSEDQVTRRIKSVIAGVPYPCQVALILHGKGLAFERELHKRFNSAYDHNEWFLFTPEIREFVRTALL